MKGHEDTKAINQTDLEMTNNNTWQEKNETI